MNHRLHHHRHALAALFMLSIIVAGSALGQVSVSLPNLSVLPGATVRIPVNVNSVTGQNVTSYGFIISCDSTILRLTGVDISGSLSDGWSVVSNNFAGAYNAGRMNVQAATAVPAVGSGGLIYITGTAQNKAGSTILQLTSFIFNTGTPTQTITNGSVRVNRAPSIAAIADKNAAQAVLLTFTASATDPDLPNDTLTYTMSNAPQGATLVPSTGVFSWTPTYAQVGLYTVTIKVTDTGGASDSTVVRITVAKTNVKPSFTKRLPDTTIAESKTMSYTYAATDVNNDALTFSLINAPTGASITTAGVFSWSPNFGQAGIYPITAIVSDGSLADTARSTLVVTKTNRPPHFGATLRDTTINEGTTLKFNYSATDPDDNTTLVYGLLNAPTGATIDGGAGILTFVVPTNPARTYVITALVTDGSIFDTTKATVTINRKPVSGSHVPVSLSTVSQNKSQQFLVSATDPDANPLTFTWKVNGVVAKSGPDSTYTATWTDPNGTPKTVVCVFADPLGLKDSVTWAFNITDVLVHDGSIPTEYALGQNYPNPFNPSTTIRFDLPKNSHVTMEIFNALGVRVRTLLRGDGVAAGRHQILWNGRDDNGTVVPSGVYLYRVIADNFRSSKKMMLVK